MHAPGSGTCGARLHVNSVASYTSLKRHLALSAWVCALLMLWLQEHSVLMPVLGPYCGQTSLIMSEGQHTVWACNHRLVVASNGRDDNCWDCGGHGTEVVAQAGQSIPVSSIPSAEQPGCGEPQCVFYKPGCDDVQACCRGLEFASEQQRRGQERLTVH